MGERELAEDTGLARSAYMSSESALRTELLLEDAEDTEDTLLTLRDLRGQTWGTLTFCSTERFQHDSTPGPRELR